MQVAPVDAVRTQWIEKVAALVADAGILTEDVESRVRSAFTRVDRELFVDSEFRAQSLEDTDLPLGNGQWLRRPSLLIRMASLSNLQKRMRVLVAGSGSGYLCAVLNAAGAQVFGVEQVAALAQSSRKLLDSLGYHGVIIHRGNASKGWQEVSPFDSIIVTYGVNSELDLPLDQLGMYGTLIAPVFTEHEARLTVWRRNPDLLKRTVFETVEVC